MSRYSRAARAFEDFKGERPTKIRRARLPDDDVTGYEMGPVVGIAYKARRDGKTAQYFHEFKPAARPNLVAQDDGRKLYIEGGRYRVTDRGIEDMPNLYVMNPSPRGGSTAKKKGASNMRRSRARRRRSSAVTVFTSNPRRRRSRSRARRSYRRNPVRRSVYRRNPRRRSPSRRRSFRRNPGAATVYRRNPRRRARARRRGFLRNPIGGTGFRFMDFILPAILVGAGGVFAEIVTGYLPIPLAWKTGYPRLLVKAGVGIAAGWAVSSILKQKKAGFYIAAGAVVLVAHDLIKMLIVANAPNVKGLGYVNPGSLTRFGYGRPMPGQFGYGRPVRQPFGGSAPDRIVGGEWNFAY